MAAPDYTSLFDSAGQAANIDPLLLRAIQQKEDATGDPNATNPKSGAKGIIQFLPSTAAEQGVDATNPGSSIYGAAHYLNGLWHYYGNDDQALHYALSTYGGDLSGKAGYADSVLKSYRALQAQASKQPGADDVADKSSAAAPTTSSGDQGGIKITMKAAPAPGGAQQGGASFVPPPNVPDTFGKSDQPGSRAQHTLQASEYGPAPGGDFASGLSGAASPTAAKPQAAAPAPPSSDFAGGLSAPAQAAPTAPAAVPTAAQPAAGPQVAPEGIQPPATPAADATTPSAASLTTPPQPSWWQRNVATPFAEAYNPLTKDAPPLNYLLGSPTAQAGLAGFLQGPRDVARTATDFAQYANQNPTLAAIDRAAPQVPLPLVGGTVGGATPDQLAATAARLKAEQAQNEQQYGGSLAYKAGNVAGDLFATIPFLGPVGKLGMTLAEQAPGVVARTMPFLNTVFQGGGQNVLTSPDKAPGEAFSEGGAGALALHGLFGAAGAKLSSGGVRQAVNDADDLGFELSSGDRYGGRAKQVEDVTRYTPGSGAATKDAQYRTRINTVINRNMGIDSPVLDQQTLRQATDNSGRLMDQIKNVSIDGNTDQTFQTALADLHQQAADRGIAGITKQIDNIWNIMARPKNGGTFPGQSIQDLVGRGGTLDNMIRDGGPGEGLLAQQIKDAVYDAAERSTSNPQAVRDFTNGRYIYKVMKTVEPLVNKTGELDDATYAGVARRIAQQNFYQDSDMAKLGRVLSGPLAELKSSGTGRQLLTARGLGLMGGETSLGAGLAYLSPSGIDQILAAAAPWAMSAGLGRGLRFGPSLGSETSLGGATVGAARQIFNPLLPRVAGPTIATNPLLTNQQRQP